MKIRSCTYLLLQPPVPLLTNVPRARALSNPLSPPLCPQLEAGFPDVTQERGGVSPSGVWARSRRQPSGNVGGWGWESSEAGPSPGGRPWPSLLWFLSLRQPMLSGQLGRRLFPMAGRVCLSRGSAGSGACGPVEAAIRTKLEQALNPEVLELRNESGGHAVPPGSETHFRVAVVSSRFEGLSPLQRHRLVHAALSEELAGPVHALAIQARTPAQWRENPQLDASPPCLGGSKKTRTP